MEAVPCGGVMLSTLQTALEDQAFGWVPGLVQNTAMCDKGIRDSVSNTCAQTNVADSCTMGADRESSSAIELELRLCMHVD
jgi:hypothetical protein